MESDPADNVVYIDEFNRKRWLRNLERERTMARLGIQNTDLAVVIPIDKDPDDIA